MIGSESDEENELLIENFDNETFEQLIGSSIRESNALQ